MILEIFSDLNGFSVMFAPPRRFAPFLEVLDGAWSKQSSPRKTPQGILSKSLDLKEIKVFCGGELLLQSCWEMHSLGMLQDPMSLKPQLAGHGCRS